MARTRTKKQPRRTPPAPARRLLFALLAVGMVLAQLLGVGHLVFWDR